PALPRRSAAGGRLAVPHPPRCALLQRQVAVQDLAGCAPVPRAPARSGRALVLYPSAARRELRRCRPVASGVRHPAQGPPVHLRQPGKLAPLGARAGIPPPLRPGRHRGAGTHAARFPGRFRVHRRPAPPQLGVLATAGRCHHDRPAPAHDAGEGPGVLSMAAMPVPSRKSRWRLPLVGAGLLLVLLAAWIAAGPWLAVRGIADALERRDSTALARHVDFPRLQANLRAQVQDRMVRAAGADVASHPLGALALAAAGSVAGAGVELAATPQGVAALLQGHVLWQRVRGRDRGSSEGWSVEPARPLRDARLSYES